MEKVLRTICCFVVVLLVSTVSGDKSERTYARCKVRPNTNDGVTLTQWLSGTITFEEMDDGTTKIGGTVSGFTTDQGSKHGFHIHAGADTGNDCNTNGGHFNPMNKDHGAPDAETRHVGDLGNIVVDASGKAKVQNSNQNTLVKLTGTDNVIGKSIVIHAGEDDLGLGGVVPDSLTTGNAGGRLACCVIEEYKKVTYTSTCELADNTLQDAEVQGLSGTITLTQDLGDGNFKTTIEGTVKGFDTTDGQTEHGFHIHQTGDTSNNCNLNGGHYNPMGIDHGGPTANIRHYGDLGNIVENNAGDAPVEMEDDYVELFGIHSVVGRSIVVHVGKDDLGQGGVVPDSLTTGNAGGRLACCKISTAKETISAGQKLAPFSLIVSLLFVVVRRVLL